MLPAFLDLSRTRILTLFHWYGRKSVSRVFWCIIIFLRHLDPWRRERYIQSKHLRLINRPLGASIQKIWFLIFHHFRDGNKERYQIPSAGVQPTYRPISHLLCPNTKLTVNLNLLKPTGHVMHQQFNIQQLYALPTLYLCVLYLSEKNNDLCHLQHELIGFHNRDEKCSLCGTNWVFNKAVCASPLKG